MDWARTRWQWFVERAEGAHARAWLALLSFSESSVFLIPPDPLLVAMVLAVPDRWRYFAVYTTLYSVLGAVAGYILGAFFFQVAGAPLIRFYGLEQEAATVALWFERDAFVVMLFAAITPIPFKVFVLAAGFLRIDFLAFLIASFLGRFIRYGAIAYATRKVGWHTLHLLARHSVPALVISVILLAAFLSRHFLGW